MKKLALLLWLPLALVLVACGKSPKDEFISRVESQYTEKPVTYEMTLKLDDVTSKGVNPIASFIGKEIKATMTQDLSKKLISIQADLSDVNPTLSDFEIVYVGDKAYMTVEPMLGMYGITSSDLSGKYMDVADAQGSPLPDLGELTPANKDNVSFFKEMDSKNFTKSGDKVSLSLTIEELLAFTQKVLESGDEETKEIAQQYKAQMETAQKAFAKDSKFVMSVGKQNNVEAVLTMKSADNKEDSMTIKMSIDKIDYQAPKIPAKEDIISQEQMQQSLMAGNGATTNSDYQMTDEEFQEFYTALEAEVANHTKAEMQELIDALAPSLTDDQAKKLEGLLSKIKDAA
ncbi:hypothetical protein [Streptococcus ovuberis]|uniref:Lipoprotein n=1 Tax=Streptococcus ovuberis TaxID=1936207 RepID=A0A7X6S0M5_9STRE|nr:hypothetical protein [Streptococcus ovuberis]NKZ19922.1 hypothetical protein [Streptococcus ovuberis]